MQILEAWTSKICKPAASGDGAPVRAAAAGVDPETFRRVIAVVEEREGFGKRIFTSLLQCQA